MLLGLYSVEVVVKKLLTLVAAALCMAACSDSSVGPSAASKVSPSNQGSRDDFTCRSGYIVAFDENGNPYCVATDRMISAPTGTASVPAAPHG